jgi:glycerate dehydrogenase
MEKEPPHPDNPLLRLKFPERLIITPHVAWATIEQGAAVKGIIDNILNYLNDIRDVEAPASTT